MTEPLRIGLVGAGGIAHAHLPNLLRLGEVLVYSEVGAAELVATYGGEVVDTLDELLARVDVVDVATPTYTHAEVVRAALAAGKDVVSEKPLARTDADADDLVARADAAGLQLYPAHVVRFFPQYARLKAAVDDGLLGDLAVLRFSRSGAFPSRTAWFADRELSGGIIMDQMIHDLDIARWVAGEVVRVSAVTTRRGDVDHPVEAAHVLLTHASGAISHVAGIWGPPHLSFTTEYSVTGTRGSLAHSSAAEQNYTADLATPDAVDGSMPEVDPAEDPYFVELEAYLGAFRGGPTPRVTAEDGAIAVKIANAALESLATGQPVEFTAAAAGTTAADTAPAAGTAASA
ncbi:Gfo/Idh/MocA family protein [Curtobacterium sp. Leaf261]|uniref:Gfo/Idh/MocA family protein n=1 Tax=Curtobacterium sp. Leaf261 TaxID=1736311 RepID=UPI0009EC4953|nr:Gfo/Idh/MocA family oxidoreductase [Curtobacterium sp. Leaf261]